jgi:hypothetical protein
MDGVFEEQVRQRAYEIWVDLGRADGQAHDHWIAAERALMQPAKPKKARAPAKAKTAAEKTVKVAAPKVVRKRVARPAESIGASA